MSSSRARRTVLLLAAIVSGCAERSPTDAWWREAPADMLDDCCVTCAEIQVSPAEPAIDEHQDEAQALLADQPYHLLTMEDAERFLPGFESHRREFVPALIRAVEVAPEAEPRRATSGFAVGWHPDGAVVTFRGIRSEPWHALRRRALVVGLPSAPHDVFVELWPCCPESERSSDRGPPRWLAAGLLASAVACAALVWVRRRSRA